MSDHTAVDKYKKGLWLRAAGLYLVLFAANCLTPRFADDMDQAVTRHGGFGRLFPYLLYRYHSWSGRMVADFNSVLFLSFPKIVFNMISAGMFTLLILLIYRHALGCKSLTGRRAHVLLTAVEVIAFFCIPDFGQIVLWECGACNYLWTMTFMLAFLLPYRMVTDAAAASGEMNTGNPDAAAVFIQSHPRLFTGLSIFGVIAGWTNENTAGGMIFLELCAIGMLLFRKRKVPAYLYSGLAFSILGFLGMILAPGNTIRRTYNLESNPGSVEMAAESLLGVCDIYLRYPGLVFVVLTLVISGTTVLLSNASAAEKKRVLIPSAIFALTSLLVILAYCAAGSAPSFYRGIFGAAVFFFIASLIPAAKLVENEISAKVLAAVCAGCSALMLLQMAAAVPGIGFQYLQETRRQTYLKEQQELGNLNPVIPLIDRKYETRWTSMTGLADISEGTSGGFNGAYGKYFSLDSVTGVRDRSRWYAIWRSGEPALMNVTDRNTYLNGLFTDGYVHIIAPGKMPPDCLTGIVGDISSDTACLLIRQGSVQTITKEEASADYPIQVGNETVIISFPLDLMVRPGTDKIDLPAEDEAAVLSFREDGSIADCVYARDDSDLVLRK